MTDLSPAAQAVLDAFRAVPDLRDCPSIATHLEHRLIAALRAAADQVVPIRLIDEPDFSPGSWCERVLREERTKMRGDLLAIAAELEGSND